MAEGPASMIVYFLAAGFGVFAVTVIAGIVKSLKERVGEPSAEERKEGPK